MVKTAIITGATAGIGHACAVQLAAQGYSLALLARRVDRLHNLANALTAAHPAQQFVAAQLDVRDKQQVQQVLSNLPAPFKSPTLLVNNAGLARGLDPFYRGDTDDWDTMLDTNVKGLLYVSRIVTGWMKEQSAGMVINIGSIAALDVYPNAAVYCASKAAVNALSQGMRIDLLPFNIRVTAIHPGMAETEFSLVRFKGDAERAAKTYQGLQPLMAEDIADAVVYAATRQAHVNIDEMVIKPTAQANVYNIKKD